LDSIGSLIDSCLVKKTKKNYWQIKLISDYPKIVGKVIASNTKLLFFHDSQATIICRNSIWMNELKNTEPVLIEKLNQYIGKKMVVGITVKIGNIEKKVQKVEVKKKPELTNEEEAWIEETKNVVPESLQVPFKSLLIAYKELKK
jgi:predicted nucleic acid-binding Zn ribbon protein